ncbi:leucine zipper transcription factor-like protein 1 [Haliotis rufescens]|uniref:leucine zipper transcription factor-like protein 1 n=1 Tax=Haliotis rufescens TaxID=6454 RepID=UPI001EAFE1E9|nr:leucine zipper transcription factor-like protein 1 [Haliotis rufescens]
MASELGVNQHHQSQVINYIRFARYQRGQRLRAVDACFDELRDSRLTEGTFTIDEVTEMLEGLQTVVRSEAESELLNTAHTNVLMMRQMFIQAEKWHLKLQADISELENRDLLEQIKDFEEREFSGTKRDTEFTPSKLAPLNETGGTALLHMKIEELEEENKTLERKLQLYEAQMSDEQKRQLKLSGDLDRLNSQMGSMKGKQGGADSEEIRRKLADMQTELDSTRKKGQLSEANMETDLAGTKHELLRIREMLEMAEKELEKKVSQTNPFKNLKQMLMKKNDQMKELRKRLSKYETVED